MGLPRHRQQALKVPRLLPPGFKGSPLRWRIEKWFWAGMCPAWCVLFFASRSLFLLISILYVIEISHWALVLSSAACETAAEARNMADPSKTPDGQPVTGGNP